MGYVLGYKAPGFHEMCKSACHLENNFLGTFSEGPRALMVAILIGQMVTQGLWLSSGRLESFVMSFGSFDLEDTI